jgi:sigma-B regulation protein RsbU (phosphoserine phosphatase)
MKAMSVLGAAVQYQFTSSQLFADTLFIAIGFIAVAVACASVAVFLIRKNRVDWTLLYFALFALLYGVRILLGTPVFRGGLGVPRDVAAAAVNFITYIIQIPAVLFAVTIIDGWQNRLAKLLFGLGCIEAIAGTAATLVGRGGGIVLTANNLLVLFVFVPAYVALFAWDEKARNFKVLQISFCVFIAAVLFDNMGGLGVFRTPIRVEYFGFIVLLAGMGWSAAQRAISDQQRLVAIERELDIARTIQKSILPEEVPQVAGLEIAVRHEPMTAVAGDFYDFVRIDERRFGVLVADVSGHGVPAALIASMLKMAFATHSSDAADPAQLLAKLNGAMCGKFSAHFVTAVYAVIDMERGTITYSGAAHPPILLGRNGSTQELAENGLMLGAFPFAQYANASVPLGAGDRLLLYTDGLVEASNARQEEFGAERLRSTLDGGSAAQIVARVFESVGAWSGLTNGRSQEDDLTAVAISVRA